MPFVPKEYCYRFKFINDFFDAVWDDLNVFATIDSPPTVCTNPYLHQDGARRCGC